VHVSFRPLHFFWKRSYEESRLAVPVKLPGARYESFRSQQLWVYCSSYMGLTTLNERLCFIKNVRATTASKI